MANTFIQINKPCLKPFHLVVRQVSSYIKKHDKFKLVSGFWDKAFARFGKKIIFYEDY